MVTLRPPHPPPRCAAAPTRLAALVLAALVLAALPVRAQGPEDRKTDDPPLITTPEQTRALIRALEQQRKGSKPCTALVARYSDGSGFHGWTHVRLAAGQIAVKHSQRGQDLDRAATFTAAAQAAECKAILKATLGGKLWTVRNKRKLGIPDETRPEIGVGLAGVGLFAVQVWANEGRDSRAFSAVRAALLALARRVSGGKVTY